MMHLAIALASAVAFLITDANAQPLRIGDIASYKAAGFLGEPYRKGWTLALERINLAGGVNGRRLEVISQDDEASPSTAKTITRELVELHRVHAIMGGFDERISAAISGSAQARGVVYVSASSGPYRGGEGKTDHTFRLRPPQEALVAMIMPDALRLKKRYWAIVGGKDRSDSAAIQVFKQTLRGGQPQSEIVFEFALSSGVLGETRLAQLMRRKLPEAVFTTLQGAELKRLAETLPLGTPVVSVFGGEPEFLRIVRPGTTQGWLVTGYPQAGIDYLPHKQFVEAYVQRWGEGPGIMSIIGYCILHSIAQALRRGDANYPAQVRPALEGLETLTPLGVIEWRRTDHQSTMGAFVGQLSHRGGKELTRWRFEPGRDALPPEPWELGSSVEQ